MKEKYNIAKDEERSEIEQKDVKESSIYNFYGIVINEFHNDDEIDLNKVKAQFKEMTDRALRDFGQDLQTFPAEYDSERPVERRVYSR